MPMTDSLLTKFYIVAETRLPPWPVRTNLSIISKIMNPMLTPVPLGNL